MFFDEHDLPNTGMSPSPGILLSVLRGAARSSESMIVSIGRGFHFHFRLHPARRECWTVPPFTGGDAFA